MQAAALAQANARRAGRISKMSRLGHEFGTLWANPNTEPEALRRFFMAHGFALAMRALEKGEALEARILDWICKASWRDDDALPRRLALFALFMREFDGRFEMPYANTLYTALCDIEPPYFQNPERDVPRWFATVATVTRFLAEELRLPMVAGRTNEDECKSLPAHARFRRCWPVYAVLADRFPDECNAVEAFFNAPLRYTWTDAHGEYLRALCERAADAHLRAVLAAQEALGVEPEEAVEILRAETAARNRAHAARVAARADAFAYADRAVNSRLADVVSVRELRDDITRRAFFDDPPPFPAI